MASETARRRGGHCCWGWGEEYHGKGEEWM